MKNNNRITMVVVDTSVLQIANFDFLGIKSDVLPLFFNAIKEKSIMLVSHPILESEILRHIEESSICKNQKTLFNMINKNKKILELSGLDIETLTSKLEGFDAKEKLAKAFLENYSSAKKLSYSDPAIIFNKYFNAVPPFSATGDKKNEFPDAFIIQAIKDYLEKHPKERALIISNDNDWISAFGMSEQIVICNRIEEGTEKINEIDCVIDKDDIKQIYIKLIDNILEKLQVLVEEESYTLSEYEFIDDFETDNVVAQSLSGKFYPLKITRNSVLLKAKVKVDVDGHGVVFDDAQAYWDREDNCYYYRPSANLDLKNGECQLDFETLIEFDFDNPIGTSYIKSIRLTNSFDNDIYGGEVKLETIYEEDNCEADRLDALEEFYKRK